MKKLLVVALAGFATIAFAHNSYTGGYSGAPGRQTCASSCHGGTSGTLTVTGFPTSYSPQHTYRIVIGHNGGSRIVNFNATTRLGTSSTVAGTFAIVTNTALYTGADGGVYANPHSIDSAVFQWTAPAAGNGTVNFYAAGFQGTTSSSSGQSRAITLSATESTTGVNPDVALPKAFALNQNYPNPFNPSTTLSYDVPTRSHITLRVYNTLGQEVATLVDEDRSAGSYSVVWDASGIASGTYLTQLTADGKSVVQKMVLLK